MDILFYILEILKVAGSIAALARLTLELQRLHRKHKLKNRIKTI